MTRASAWQQLKGLLYRNLLIKKRNPKQTAKELLTPIYLIVILIAIQLTIKVEHYAPIPNITEDSQIGDFKPINSSVAVSPNTSEVHELVDTLFLPAATCMYFSSEKDLINSYVYSNGTKFGAALIFTNQSNLSKFKIRFPKELQTPPPLTLTITQDHCRTKTAVSLNNCLTTYYLRSGFTAMQRKINQALIQKLTGISDLMPTTWSYQMMPKPAFDTPFTVLSFLLPIYLVLALSPLPNFVVITLVNEKQKKIKETMKIMGLRLSVYWLSWIIVYMVSIIIIAIIMVAMLKFGKVFGKANFLLIFLLIFLYGASIVTFSCALTPLFTNSLTAGTVASFSTSFFSLLYLPVGLNKDSISSGGLWALSLISPTSFAIAIDTAYKEETTGGLQFNNVFNGTMPFVYSIVMLIVDTIIYALIAFYLDNVIAGEFGSRRSIFFCFQPSYWLGNKRVSQLSSSRINILKPQEENVAGVYNLDDIEAVPSEMESKVAFRILNIRKEFVKKKYEPTDVAVNDLSLDIYEDHITALLGHNGAGKTTLINMLTGIITPTHGTAMIYNLDVTDNNCMDEIRSMSGVCPQHDILIDEITVQEHLKIFALIKGVNPSTINDEVISILNDTGLMEKKDSQPNKMSGGEKRRLSVGIALIGNPKILFLDEPTSGVDPVSRRQMWSLLKRCKKGKAILLTTHFMDEADILADRKAIISKGKLRCAGSSLFLKSRFGIGYHLTMVLTEEAKKEVITSFVKKYVATSEFGRSHGMEASYILPLREVSAFANLFEAVDGAKTDLGIQSYGVSMTSLEEVFLKLGEELEDNQDSSVNLGKNLVTNIPYSSANRTSLTEGSVGVSAEPSPMNSIEIQNNIFEKLLSLMWIRVLLTIRNPIALTFRIFMPTILIVIGIVIGSYAKISLTEDPEIGTNPGLYVSLAGEKKQFPFVYQQSSGINLAEYVNILNKSVSTLSVTNYSSLLSSKKQADLGSRLSNFDPSGKSSSKWTLWYNDSALHSIPVATNLLDNVFLYGAMVYNNRTPSFLLDLTIQPLPAVNDGRTKFDPNVFSIVLLIAFGVVMIPTGFGVEAVMDREVKARNSLRIAGASFFVYWSSMLTIHFLTYFIAFIVCLIMLSAFQLTYFTYPGAMESFALIFLLYMPSTTLFCYNLSFLFAKRESAQSVLPLMMMLILFLPYIPIMVFEFLPDLNYLSPKLHIIFAFVFPCYPLVGGLHYITKVYSTKFFDQITFNDYFTWSSNIPITFITPIVHSILFFILLYLLDCRSLGINLFSKKGKDSSVFVNTDIIAYEDEDVNKERQKVEHEEFSSSKIYPHTSSSMNSERVPLLKDFPSKAPVLIMKNLRKVFGETKCCKRPKANSEIKIAVRNLSLSINNGEIFGLLGPNGAGKTTAMSIMCAEQAPDRGKVFVNGYDITKDFSEVFKVLGYCPQHDALWENITLTEHIACYASICGVRRKIIKEVSNFHIKSLKLNEYSSKKAKQLSGGTKRKLSYIISILGNPKIVLLDEPSTGMDPQSKRLFWDAITSFFHGDRNAILTTHSMEEADAVCSRVGIMIRGALRCLGSTQHLKDRHGRGYQLEIKLTSNKDLTSDEHFNKLHYFVREHFPSAQLDERFENRVSFSIPHSEVQSLGNVFSLLGQAKEIVGIEEYNFSQTTLEQVFLGFAKEQELGTESTNI